MEADQLEGQQRIMTTNQKGTSQFSRAWIKGLAQDALDIQLANNLSAVVHSFAIVIDRLREIARAEGWGYDAITINTHPICILYAAKISALAAFRSPADGNCLSDAYTEVQRLAAMDKETAR